MSPQNQTTSEASPLLWSTRLAGRSSRRLWRERFTFSPETLLIPVVFASKLGRAIPATTLAELSRQTVCRLSIALRGHPASLARHPGPPQYCDAPQVVQDFAIVTAVFGVIGSLTALVACGILNRILLHGERKPVFLFLFASEIAWCCLVLGLQFMPDELSDWVFLVGMLFNTISDNLPFSYLVNMYIVDVCGPEQRTTIMSKTDGWGVLGVSIPLALGGSITTSSGDPLIVFYIETAIFFGIFIYVVFILPETFSEGKQNALSRMRQESSADDIPKGLLAPLSAIFDPLKVLVSSRTLDGTHNWRLVWCAAHSFVLSIAHGYVWSAWFVLVSSKYHITPADTGLFWSCVTFTGMVTLTVIVPQLLRFLRPYYARRTPFPSPAGEGLSNGEVSVEGTSDHLDVHLAFVACIFMAIFTLCAAATRSILVLFICAVFTGLAFMHGPTTHSLVSRSVDQHKQGEAMAAIHMINSAGGVLSPIIMGTIFSATVDTVPLILFYVHLVVVLVSAGLLLLVRDEDGHHEPSESSVDQS